MRFALLSDIHANLTGLRAVATAIEVDGPFDQVIVAGDHLVGGARPVETWEALRELGWTLVRGNHDDDVAGKPLPDYGASHEGTVEHVRWTRERVGPAIAREMGELPFSVRVATLAGDLLAVHSSPRSTYDKCGGPHNTLEEVEAAYGGTGATAIAYGHWHASYVRPTPTALLMNVASVGLPKHGLPLAAYTVLTGTEQGWCVEQRQVPYDSAEERAAAAAVGLPAWEPRPRA